MNIKSVILKKPDNIDECFNVRFFVFVEEQGFKKEIELDEYDDVAYHVLLKKDDVSIATARFFQVDDYYKIGRVCVLKEYRELKLGKLLLDCIEEKVKELKINKIYLNSQYDARGFYLKCGYQEVGEIFYEEGCKHIKMFKSVR